MTIRSAEEAASFTWSRETADRSGGATRPDDPRPDTAAARSTALCRVRLAMVMEATPDRARARATARAEPPAPTISALLPRGANPASPSRARIKPMPSVLCPTRAAPSLRTVLTAPASEAQPSTSSR